MITPYLTHRVMPQSLSLLGRILPRSRLSRPRPLATLTPSIYAKVTAACAEHAVACSLLEDGVNERGRPLDHTDYARLSKQTSAQAGEATKKKRGGCTLPSAVRITRFKHAIVRSDRL